jgi:hypothetical protein
MELFDSNGHVDAYIPGGLDFAVHSIEMTLNQGSEVNGAKEFGSQLLQA